MRQELRYQGNVHKRPLQVAHVLRCIWRARAHQNGYFFSPEFKAEALFFVRIFSRNFI